MGKWAFAPAGIPSAASDNAESFDNRFGKWGSAAAGSSGDTDFPLLRALEKYRSLAAPDGLPSAPAAPTLSPASSNADNSSMYVFDPTKPPPPFTPSNYAASYGNINKWISSLAGVDPGDPTEFSPPPIFSPLYRR